MNSNSGMKKTALAIFRMNDSFCRAMSASLYPEKFQGKQTYLRMLKNITQGSTNRV